jgi:hypothetical protein
MARPTPKMPTRMSTPKIEDTKPSRLIELFWWFVFIVPIIFVWWSTGSIIGVIVLIAIRILIMFIPKFWKKEQVATQSDREPIIIQSETVNTRESVLKPYIEEAKQEWYGLLKFAKIYDKENEDKNLAAYRKLRGWE